jgi:hypothetical protein
VSAHVRAVRAAASAILVAHAFKTAFALALLGGLGLELARAANSGAFIELVRTAIMEAPRHVAAAQWAALGYVVIGPLLTQYVLAALLGRPRARAAALARYPRALGLNLACWTGGVLTALALWLLSVELAAAVDPAFETPARLVPLALAAGCALVLSTVHDMALAELAVSDAPRALRALRQAARALTLKLLVAHVAFMLGAACFYLAGEAASRALGPLAGLAAAQACALGASFARAGWLSVLATNSRLLSAGSLEPADTSQPELTG